MSKTIILTEDEVLIIQYLMKSYAKDNPAEIAAIESILESLHRKLNSNDKTE